MTKKEESRSNDINKAIPILKRGGVVIFPTDTVFGIGCVWNNSIALARIKKIKGSNQSFPILIDNLTQLHKLAYVTEPAQHLIDRFWPGALTLLLKSRHDRKKIGIRMPRSKITRELIAGVGVPLIGTSANFHTKKAPTHYGELDENFKKLADYTVNGECDLKKESTVVDATSIPLKILRYGALNIK